MEKTAIQTIAELKNAPPAEMTYLPVTSNGVQDAVGAAHFSFSRLILVLCLAWLTLNLPLRAGRPVIPWDAMDEFYPMVYFNAHSLRLGLAPWWNPHIYSGFPQIADPQGMLFSPLLMAWMLLRETPGPVWFTWGVLLHVLMGGIAMLVFLRRQNGNVLGALMGAMVYMAGGVAASPARTYTYRPCLQLRARRAGFPWTLPRSTHMATRLVVRSGRGCTDRAPGTSGLSFRAGLHRLWHVRHGTPMEALWQAGSPAVDSGNDPCANVRPHAGFAAMALQLGIHQHVQPRGDASVRCNK